MFARLGTDYKIRNQLFFAILEALILFSIINLFYSVCTKNVFVIFLSGIPAWRRYFQHAHFIPMVGVGKRGEY